MGRPLKIKKSATSDIGFPNNGSNGYDITKPGVVGGFDPLTNVAKVRVKIDGFTEDDGYIIRQKGKRKFLVAGATDIQDEDIIQGRTYIINNASATDWTQFGAPINAGHGSIFTAKIAGSAAVVNNGTVRIVATCQLADLADASLTDGTMTVTYTDDAAGTGRLSQLTNHWGADFAVPKNKYLVAFNGTAAAGATPGTPYAKVSILYWT